ncbi:MAG TPA: nucleoside hydrolase [Jiangellaceae bacterium]
MSLAVVAVVDTGVDDALALVVAARHPALDLRGVVCTAGNVPLERVLANTHYMLDLLDARVPVAVGAVRSLDGLRFTGRSVHGPDGLAGLGPRDEPPASGRVGAAAELITPDTVVVCLGPLTSLVGLPVGRVVASYARPGEANYEMDPPAARSVAAEYADVPDHPVSITTGDTPLGELVAGLLRHQARRATGLGDAAVMLGLAEPGLGPQHWTRRLQRLAAARD